MEDDDEYFGSLMDKASSGDVVEYTWYECVEGFKQADRDMGTAFHRKLEWMNRAADAYFAEKGKMAGFLNPFSKDTGVSYQYASQLNRIRKSFSECTIKNFSHDVVIELLSAPEDLREDFLSSEEPVKVKEVQKAKKGYSKLKEDPDCSDIVEQLESGRKTPREAAKEAWERSEKKRKQIEENPQVVDLEQIVKNKKHYDIRTAAISFVVAMEQMGSKSEPKDIAREIHMAIQSDPMNIKVPALFLLRDILNELCEEIETPKANQLN